MRLVLGVRTYDLTTRALVMGVLDAAGRGLASDSGAAPVDAYLARAERLVDDGADLLEVGTVTVTPVAPQLSEPEELDVVVPLVDALAAAVGVPVACATTRASVARAAYAAGAVVGDDPSGFSDPGYLPAAVVAGASVVARHPAAARGAPSPPCGTDDVVSQVRAFLGEQGGRAEKAGLPRERIVLDAGVDGLAATEQSLELLRASPFLAELGYPLASALGSGSAGPADERSDDARATTAAAAALAVVGGCRVLRTSDVRTARRVADVLAAIL
ncbi:MAG TPA: dihydropteroate synthase, partial [Acidimicrobiales bacterium]|nr:dihydropteroate synthase [Acidimicrobiales bacterium]